MTFARSTQHGLTGPRVRRVQTPVSGPRASGLRADGEFYLDGFGPVYLAPMPGGPAADRAPSRDGLDVSSLNCAAGAACAGGGFLGGVP